MEGFETFTFPTATARETFKTRLAGCGVGFATVETEEVKEFTHCFFLHLKRTTPTKKAVLTELAKTI